MTTPTLPLNEEQDNAYTLLTDLLKTWGLESLAPEALRLFQEGYTQTQVPVLLQDTDAYKQRFYGNQIRRQNRLPVLSPAEYLLTERSYRQIMTNAGLPSGFYDSPQDFNGWIGSDVSPVEVQRRVDEGVDAYLRWDPTSKATAQALFPEISADGWLAFILDQGGQRGRDELNRMVHGARIAGAARAYDVNLTREQAERFGGMSGEDYVKQASVFGRLAGVGERLSGFYGGEDYGAEEAASEVFGNNADAARRRERLFAKEQAEFGGGGTASRSGLSQGQGNY